MVLLGDSGPSTVVVRVKDEVSREWGLRQCLIMAGPLQRPFLGPWTPVTLGMGNSDYDSGPLRSLIQEEDRIIFGIGAGYIGDAMRQRNSLSLTRAS